MSRSANEMGHGAVLIGVILSICLYGIMIVQTLMYFNAFKRDPTWRKCLVGFLFILDTANSMIDVTFTYQSLVPQFGNVPHVQDTHLLLTCNGIFTMIIALAVHLFFAWRIQVLISSKWFTSAIVICALATFSGGVVTVITITHIRGFLLFLTMAEYRTFKDAMLATFISHSLTNVILTVTLVWHLKSSKTGFRDTDDMIDKIIKITVPTGMLSTVFAAAFVVSFYVDKYSRIAMIFYFPISKLYANSVVSSLNSRGRWGYFKLESCQKCSGSAPSTKEGCQMCSGEAERHYRQDIVHSMSNKQAEVQVEPHKVVDISRENTYACA